MKKLNLKLAGISDVLTNEQMKKITGGYEGDSVCHVGLPCSLFANGTTYYGECQAGFGGGSGGYMPCGCSTQYGVYEVGSNGGISRCQN